MLRNLQEEGRMSGSCLVWVDSFSRQRVGQVLLNSIWVPSNEHYQPFRPSLGRRRHKVSARTGVEVSPRLPSQGSSSYGLS